MPSGKDRDCLKVLHLVKQGHLTQSEGGAQLGVGERWVRKLLARLEREGDRLAIAAQYSRGAAVSMFSASLFRCHHAWRD